jgi:hypothetical protein
VLALAIALPSKLRVAPAETEHMPIYLRTFFRVLSSWVHHLMPNVNGPFLWSRLPGSSRVAPHWSRRGHRLVQRRSQPEGCIFPIGGLTSDFPHHGSFARGGPWGWCGQTMFTSRWLARRTVPIPSWPGIGAGRANSKKRPGHGPDPKTWSRPRSEVLVSYGRVGVSEDFRRANFVTDGSRVSLGATVSMVPTRRSPSSS